MLDEVLLIGLMESACQRPHGSVFSEPTLTHDLVQKVLVRSNLLPGLDVVDPDFRNTIEVQRWITKRSGDLFCLLCCVVLSIDVSTTSAHETIALSNLVVTSNSISERFVGHCYIDMLSSPVL